MTYEGTRIKLHRRTWNHPVSDLGIHGMLTRGKRWGKNRTSVSYKNRKRYNAYQTDNPHSSRYGG
jgi:hypothetical protein